MRILLSISLALLWTSAFAQDATVHHQVRAYDSAGAPIEGTHSVRLTLYSDDAGTTDVWRTTFPTVVFEDGYFAVVLTGNDTTPSARTLDDALETNQLFVGMAIDGTSDLTPFERLGGGLGGGRLPSNCTEGAMPYMGPSGWTCTPSGSVLQELTTTGSATNTGGWPHGAYTSSAGTQIMSVTILPTFAGSIIEVQVVGAIRENGNTSNISGMGVFRNGETNALAVAHDNGTYSPYSHGNSGAGQSHHEYLRWSGPTSSTAPITFKVRIGSDGAGIACSPGLCSMTVRERL